MGLLWLNLLTRSSTTEWPLLLCAVESVVWDAIVVNREGQWRVNNEEEEENDDERGVVLCRFQSSLFVCVCCCCCCRRGAPVLIFLRFWADSSPLENLYGASQMMGSEPRVSTTRKEIPSVWLVVCRTFAAVLVR